MVPGIAYRNAAPLAVWHALATSALGLAVATRRVLLVDDLLSGIALEEVHARGWRSTVLEVDHICGLLNERDVWTT